MSKIISKIFLTLGVLSFVFSPFNTEVLAVDQYKTTETFIFSRNTQVTGSQSFSPSFSLYIGDNISGIANPVKSAFFIVSGLYTGGGTVVLKINSLGTSTYTLPSVTNPTAFEIIYKDTVPVITPTTSGTFTYTFNIDVGTGLTISGLNAKLLTTYRFVPPACQDGTTQKIKTIEVFVGDSNTQISTQINKSFSLYLGDNISGITNPIKSINFEASGVYTGTGSLELKLDSDAATSRTFTLPNVTDPTPFEILYKDPSNKINPTSSGTYNYTFNVIPSGVTISGFAATVIITYRYIPPTCGVGLPATGDLLSAVFDTTASADGPGYNSILWKGSLNAGPGRVRFQLATSANSTGPWNYYGGATCTSGDWYDPGAPDTAIEITCAPANHNNQRYFKYKVQLCSAADCAASGTISPRVDDVVISWSP